MRTTRHCTPVALLFVPAHEGVEEGLRGLVRLLAMNRKECQYGVCACTRVRACLFGWCLFSAKHLSPTRPAVPTTTATTTSIGPERCRLQNFIHSVASRVSRCRHVPAVLLATAFFINKFEMFVSRTHTFRDSRQPVFGAYALLLLLSSEMYAILCETCWRRHCASLARSTVV